MFTNIKIIKREDLGYEQYQIFNREYHELRIQNMINRIGGSLEGTLEYLLKKNIEEENYELAHEFNNWLNEIKNRNKKQKKKKEDDYKKEKYYYNNKINLIKKHIRIIENDIHFLNLKLEKEKQELKEIENIVSGSDKKIENE